MEIQQRAGSLSRSAAVALLLFVLPQSQVAAQSTQWDAAISNTNWYVPIPQLLAYGAPGTSFANPIPLGDQTLWTLGTAVNGSFSGQSSARLSLGNIVTSSSLNMQGQVAPDGSVVIVFR